jgi:hypothetical protein
MKNQSRIPRDYEGHLTKYCEVNVEVKIGSYDCTANCPHNENTRKEIEEEAFDLEFVRCSKIQTQNQLQIEL